MRLSNSHHALLLTEYARDQGRIDDLIPVLFRANFVDGRNLADPEVLRSAATEAGLNPDAAMEGLNSPGYAERIGQALIEGQRSGITGVPGFIIDGRYRIVGAIPYEQMAAALRQIQQAPA